jgi:hypothetical protein
MRAAAYLKPYGLPLAANKCRVRGACPFKQAARRRLHQLGVLLAEQADSAVTLALRHRPVAQLDVSHAAFALGPSQVTH